MKEVFEKAILTYGQTAQEDVAIEEMSELIKAICKMRRAGLKTGLRRPRHARNNHSFRKGCGNCITAVLPYCYVGVSGGFREVR